jgi:hypothetical protein
VPTTRARRPASPGEAEKRMIISACGAFIRDVLKPRFLPQIRPTEWNYVVDIRGAWAAGRYRFMQRYRSGMGDNLGEEFDATIFLYAASSRYRNGPAPCGQCGRRVP